MKCFLNTSATLTLVLFASGCQSESDKDFVDFRNVKSGVSEGAPKTGTETTASSQTQETPSTTQPAEQMADVQAVSANTQDQPLENGIVPAVANQSVADNSADTTNSGEQNSQSTDNANRLVTSSQSGLQGTADQPEVDNSVSGEVRKVELLVPEKRFRKEMGQAFRVTYDDIDLLKVLNMEPVPANATEFFPEWLKSLDGQIVRIRGFMFPTYKASGLTEFTLARDNGICCFVRQPKIYDIIGVSLAEGEVTDYIEARPFDVEGTFHIDPLADDAGLSRIYRIDQAKVLQ